ncbi:MAG: carbonic anhydrase family protein [Elainella sp. Prado103]|jgi:carbonic anhydrase|nr:carbonic anhydrase family protein [Elainella sp. Prado103]
MMNRRELLKLVALNGMGTCISFGDVSLSYAITNKVHSWGYVGEGSPTHWGELADEYQVCKMGLQQSPINLQEAIEAGLSPIAIHYQEIPLSILNNGYTVQVNAAPGNTLTLDGIVFELIQFHFHHPSEHQQTSRAYPMELHLVHKSASGELAVLGIFLQEGAENETLKPIWAAIPSPSRSATPVDGVTVFLPDLLPTQRDHYRYFGSLTTPPCSETVRWTVFDEPIRISRAQIEQFARIFPPNARPIQPLNRRYLLHANL